MAFLRAAGPEDPLTSLWVLDVATGRRAGGGRPDARCWPATPPTCRPRSGSGASGPARAPPGSPATPPTPSTASVAAALAGQLVVADLVAGTAAMVPVPSAVIDPRPDPTGDAGGVGRRPPAVGRSSSTTRRRHGCWPARTTPRCAGAWPSSSAAEEMDRFRGYWWAPDGSGAPRHPRRRHARAALVDRRPRPPRPAAHRGGLPGRRHPERRRHRLDPAARRHPHRGARGSATTCPYLAEAAWDDHGPLLALHPRDQRRIEVRGADPRSGRHRGAVDRPRRRVGGAGAGHAGPPGRRARGGVLRRRRPPPARGRRHARSPRTTSTCAPSPTSATTAWCSPPTRSTTPPAPRCGGGPTTGSSSSPPTTACTPRSSAATRSSCGESSLDDHAPDGRGGRRPDHRRRASPRRWSTPNVTIRHVGDAPAGHRPAPPARRRPTTLGSRCCSTPTAGPHAQRVVQARSAYLTSQWFADQGFAVVVIDGRGTPGRGARVGARHPRRPRRPGARGPGRRPARAGRRGPAARPLPRRHPRVELRRLPRRARRAAPARRLPRRHRRRARSPTGASTTPSTRSATSATPTTDAARYDASSLLPDAPKLERPLLLLHGLADDNVVERPHPAAVVSAARRRPPAPGAPAHRRHPHGQPGGGRREPAPPAARLPAQDALRASTDSGRRPASRRGAPPAWAGKDLNLRRQCRLVYSQFPLATRARTQGCHDDSRRGTFAGHAELRRGLRDRPAGDPQRGRPGPARGGHPLRLQGHRHHHRAGRRRRSSSTPRARTAWPPCGRCWRRSW